MNHPTHTLIDLEKKFWRSMVAQDSETATQLLCEPALMVIAHGAMKFDHAGYRKMAEQGSMLLTSFELDDVQVVFPNDSTALLTYRVKQSMAPRGQQSAEVQEMNDTSTWVRFGDDWRCAMHTASPVEDTRAAC
jgi:hypothetical protein